MNLLVKKARKHDKAAFQQLMQQEGSSMYKIARAILKNDEDVADAMQKIHTLKKDKYFKTWMVRILINNCNAICRQRTRTVSGETIPEASFQETGYASVEWTDFLNGLEEKYRVVIILYYVEGFKTREIADILQLNENTVRGRLATARCKLEAQYRDQLRQAAPKDHSVTMQTER